MDLQHVNVKIFAEDDSKIDLAPFIEVFHQWVGGQVMDELLIDVADYRHIPDGPGVVVVGLEADYSMDTTGGRCGLRYNRKAALEGANAERFAQALRSAARASGMLETEFEDLKFSRREFEIFVNDRALAPNTPETFAACRPEIEAFLKDTLGHDDFGVKPTSDDPRSLFGVNVASAKPFDLSALVQSAS